MSIDIRRIDPFEYWDEISALGRRHALELATSDAWQHIDPKRAAYEAVSAAGLLHVLGAFDRKTLVGYSVSVRVDHPHLAVTTLTNDLLYLDEDYRNGSAGLRLMRATEQIARDLGVNAMIWCAVAGSTLDDILMRRDDYQAHQRLYRKDL